MELARHEIRLSPEETDRWYANDVKIWAPCRRAVRAQAKNTTFSVASKTDVNAPRTFASVFTGPTLTRAQLDELGLGAFDEWEPPKP